MRVKYDMTCIKLKSVTNDIFFFFYVARARNTYNVVGITRYCINGSIAIVHGTIGWGKTILNQLNDDRGFCHENFNLMFDLHISFLYSLRNLHASFLYDNELIL